MFGVWTFGAIFILIIKAQMEMHQKWLVFIYVQLTLSAKKL